MKEKLKYRSLCLLLTLILLVTGGVFMYQLISSSFLTVPLLIICGVVLLSLAAAVFLLTWELRKRIRSIIGCLLALLILVVQALGGHYVDISADALQKITNPGNEFAEVGVYVKNEDPAQSLADLKGYTFGILEVQDRSVTELALEDISRQLGEELSCKEYSGVEEQVVGLLEAGDVNAIVLNKSFLALLEETEEHESYLPQIREVYSVKVEELSTPDKPVKKDAGIFTVYFSGADYSGSLAIKSRSDVNVLATVNVHTGQILLVSTPRDYYVPLSISDGVPDKLTHAGIYGINVSRETLEMLYGIEIDYYFRVNFTGFRDIIDALGGITVVSDHSFSYGGSTFQKGTNTLNGEQALDFARNRSDSIGGDRGRGRNHMRVISAVIDKITSPALLTNYKQILDGVSDSFQTDMPYEALTKLIQNQLSKGTKWNVTTYSVDGTGTHLKPYSLSTKAYVMVPDQATVDRAKVLMEQVRNGETPQP